MHLTLFTDYALRALIYLGTHPGEVVPASRISEAYGISGDHVAKAAKWLVQHGYVDAMRGKHGGLVLARSPSSIKLGAFIQQSEPSLDLVECFNSGENRCVIAPACKLKKVLAEARKAFLAALDQYTLADVLANSPELVRLLPRAANGVR